MNIKLAVFYTPAYAYDQSTFDAQSVLSEKGCNPAAIDGLFGAKTAKAIKSFQKVNSILITGKLDSKTSAHSGDREHLIFFT